MSKPATTPRQLSGYALENHFRKLRARWRFTPLEHYVFSELIVLCNEQGWPEEFSATNAMLIAGIGCSEPGLIKARKRLAEAGLLAYTEGQHRRPTAYRFCPPEGLTEFSDNTGKHLTEGLTEFSVSLQNEGEHLTEHLTEGLTEFSPYINKTKTKLSLSEGERMGIQNLTLLSAEQPSQPPAEETSPGESAAPALAKSKASRSRRRPAESISPPEPLPSACPLAVLLNPGGLAAKVQQLAEPLTLAQAERLLTDYDEAPLRTILCEMANWPKLLTGATSANLTTRNWLNRRGIQAGSKQVPSTLPVPAPNSFDPAALFGHDNLTPEQVRARQRSGPEYAAYLAREAARTAQCGAGPPTL